MTDTSYGTDLFGAPYEADDPELAHLCTAIILGGEGGTLTLLGPVHGQTGDYMLVRQEVLDFDEVSVTYGGTSLTSAGPSLIPALDCLNPYWRTMVGVHVAPHLEQEIREELQTCPGARAPDDWRLSLQRTSLVCSRLYRGSTMWPDDQPRDAFWLEGTLDQVRVVLGRLTPDHQFQVREAANQPYAVVVSRDGLHRYALPYIESEEEDPWPPEVFLPVTSFEVMDMADLQMACLEEGPALTPEELSLKGALAYYDRLQSEVSEENPHAGIAELATVTWPVRILPPDGESGGWIIREQAQAMEQWLWPIASIGSLREAVQLSVIMRNLLHWGSTDVPGGGYDLHLQHGLLRVHEVNSLQANGSEDVCTG